jgi:hypothetical protein
MMPTLYRAPGGRAVGVTRARDGEKCGRGRRERRLDADSVPDGKVRLGEAGGGAGEAVARPPPPPCGPERARTCQHSECAARSRAVGEPARAAVGMRIAAVEVVVETRTVR